MQVACRYGRGSREGRHGAALKPLAQRSDALGGVGAFAVFVDAAERVVGEAAREGGQGVIGA